MQQGEGTPITPTNITIKAATSSGSKPNIMPISAEGRYYIFTNDQEKRYENFYLVIQNYLINLTTYLCYPVTCLKTQLRLHLEKATSTDDGDLLMIVNGTDGTIAAYSVHRSQKVVAPSEFITEGYFEDCAVDIDDIYVVGKKRDANECNFNCYCYRLCQYSGRHSAHVY